MTKKKKRVERCKRFDSFVSRDVRVMAGGYALWFENSDSGVGLMVRPSGVKSKWFLVSLEDPSKPLDLVCVEHEGVVAARGLVCSRSLPEFTGHEGGDPRFRPDPARWATKEMRQLVRQYEKQSHKPEVNAMKQKNKKNQNFVRETVPTPQPPTGMSDDALLSFNPILKSAFDKYVDKNDPFTRDLMKQIVAAALKTGAAPEKIYATIKTGRLLTTENMQFLSKADIDEWGDAAEEYKRLAQQD